MLQGDMDEFQDKGDEVVDISPQQQPMPIKIESWLLDPNPVYDDSCYPQQNVDVWTHQCHLHLHDCSMHIDDITVIPTRVIEKCKISLPIIHKNKICFGYSLCDDLLQLQDRSKVISRESRECHWERVITAA